MRQKERYYCCPSREKVRTIVCGGIRIGPCNHPRWLLLLLVVSTLVATVQCNNNILDQQSTTASTAASMGLVGFSSISPIPRGGDLTSTTKRQAREQAFVDLQEKQQERVSYVRHVLNERLQHVQSGQRGRDFAAWVRQQRGDAVVYSMHGLETLELDLPPEATSVETLNTTDMNGNDIVFSNDMMNLDLVPIASIPNQFPGKPLHLIDDRPPSFLKLFLRACKLTIKFSPITTTMWLALLSPTFREQVWYHWLSSSLASSGPAFIKWGQWASTRQDMFPSSLCNALSTLHNEAPSHSWKFTEAMLESSLGLPKGSLLQVFESIDTTPIASGSIAQVHRAVLKSDFSEDGTLVAIKVRHPHVSQLIDMDFRLMGALAKLCDALPATRWLLLGDSVSQFSHTMAAQAHLNVEAHHLEVLNYNFRKWPQVGFPQPFYASSSVIMETFETGRIITNILDHYDAIAAHHAATKPTMTVDEVMLDKDGEAQPQEVIAEGEGYQLVPPKLAKFIVTTGLSTYLKMLLVDNLMHADLHPGNMMIDVHANYPSPPKCGKQSSSRALVPKDKAKPPPEKYGIVLVDAGMVAQLTQQESVNFIGLLSSLGEGDGNSAAEFALRFSTSDDESAVLTQEQREDFKNDMEELFNEKCQGYGTDVDVGEVLRGVLSLVRKHQVRIDANYATLVVNCLCIEGLGRRLCPSYNVLDAARPLLQSFRKLCVNSDGTPKEEIEQRGFRRGIMKLFLPVLYFRKTISDNRFFRQQEREIRRNNNRNKK